MHFRVFLVNTEARWQSSAVASSRILECFYTYAFSYKPAISLGENCKEQLKVSCW